MFSVMSVVLFLKCNNINPDLFRVFSYLYNMKNLIKNIIIESLLLFEDEKHVKQLFTNWANKKSGNPELALSLMDDFLKYQKRLKRDFTSFSSAEEMKQSIDKVRQSEDEKQKSSDAVKIFENAEVLVIAANTHQASCRYAAGTKWCTGAEDTDEYWKRHNRTGTEFIWIFKNLPPSDPNYKFSLHIKWDKKYDWCNAVNRCSEKTPDFGNSNYYNYLNLTAQSAEQFPQRFDYKAVLGRCFKYHEQRLKNRVVASSGELKVKIKNHINDNIENHFDFSFDALLEESLDYVFDSVFNGLELEEKEALEIEEEYQSFIEGKRQEILSTVTALVMNDVENLNEESITEDFQFNQVNYDQTEEEYIEQYSEDYLADQLHEIVHEELSLLQTEFLESKGI